MIYLLRHGLDNENYIGGHSNIPLEKEGIKEVEKIAKYIIDNNLKINKIYTSDLTRTIQTSEIVNKKLNVPIIKKAYLRELDKGDLTGLNKKYALTKYKEYMELTDIHKKYPNGESLIDFYKRIKEYFEKILENDNTLVVTHRGVINMIYFILNNIEPTLDKEMFNVTHASLHEYNSVSKLIRRIH